MGVQIWANDAPKMQALVTNARRACGSGKLVRFQGPLQLQICKDPRFVPVRGTYPEIQELTNGNESAKTMYANAHAQEGFNMEFTDLEVPIPRLAQNLSIQAATKTIAQVYTWKTVLNGVRILTVEINGTEKKIGKNFKMIGVHDNDAADRILAYVESLQDGQGTFFMVWNVHGIVKIGVEDDVNSLPEIKGTNIWKENGEQEQIDIQIFSGHEGEALWNKVRRACYIPIQINRGTRKQKSHDCPACVNSQREKNLRQSGLQTL